jgi:NDP-sugar pyrophosphorylase family protein
VKAVVLVGGEGTRLRPLTYSLPKPLLPIANQPFLERQLSWLARHGVDEVVLSLGYLPDAFEAHFPDGRFGDLVLRYAVEDHPLGTAGAIRYAAQGIDERLVVCNGDVLTTHDLGELVAFHDARGAEATICLTQVEDPSAFGVVPTRDDGEVVAFVEKPPKGKAPTNWINAGTYVLEPSVLDRIPGGRRVSIERETFPAVVADGSLYAVGTDDYWTDTGRPDLYLAANLDALAGRRRDGRVDPLGPGCDVAGEVVDSVVGAGSRIAARASVTGSVLLPGAVVDERAQVKGSCLGAGVRVGPGATVVDCVLGDGESVPAGAELVSERRPPA